MKQSINRKKTVALKKPLDLAAASREANRCLLCKDAPCSQNCPAGTDPGRFIRQIKFENYKGAARTIRNNNPLGAVCSYICPVERLCEKACCVKALEDPINISGLQQFACSYGKKYGLEPLATAPKLSEHKIAVIGAGPAGISCATELAKAGYTVVIFEKENKAGGIATWNIPEYRLPYEAIQYDIKNLTNLGVTIKYNTNITSPNAAINLLNKDFAAVFIASGLTEPFTLPMLKGCTNVADYGSFLKAIKTKKNIPALRNKTVVVIGGGSVAVDAACQATTLGAKKTYMLALEDLANLPADREEIKLAHAMHIIIKPNTQIVSIKKDAKKKVSGIRGIEVEFKTPGNFSPNNAKKIAGTEFNLPVDYIIQAIGTKPGNELTKIVPKLKTQGKGVIVVKNNFATNIPGIFAGGDVTNGGVTIVQAVGDGKKAAQSIIDFIRGN